MDDIVKVIIILLVGIVLWMILKLISGKRKKLHVRFICSLLRMLVMIGVLIGVLQVYFDLQNVLTAVLTGGGLVLAILSFAAQKSLNNILSGIAISLSRPFDLGDKIKIISGGSVMAEGTVTDITLRHTVVMTYDGQACMVPNGTMNESMLLNVSHEDRIGNFLEITVGYGDDLDKAIALMEEVVRATDNVIDCTKPLICRFDPDGPVVKTTVWTKTVAENFVACGSIRKRLIETYRKNGITIPYRTVTVDKQEPVNVNNLDTQSTERPAKKRNKTK
ncbi:MAG: mechanosensitive ion channel family protein [Lachnospiraceae bacterium]|nr:mechanosensitive ion channel family protein [Lachnospiraceae bacterium]